MFEIICHENDATQPAMIHIFNEKEKAAELSFYAKLRVFAQQHDSEALNFFFDWISTEEKKIIHDLLARESFFDLSGFICHAAICGSVDLVEPLLRQSFRSYPISTHLQHLKIAFNQASLRNHFDLVSHLMKPNFYNALWLDYFHKDTDNPLFFITNRSSPEMAAHVFSQLDLPQATRDILFKECARSPHFQNLAVMLDLGLFSEDSSVIKNFCYDDYSERYIQKLKPMLDAFLEKSSLNKNVKSVLGDTAHPLLLPGSCRVYKI